MHPTEIVLLQAAMGLGLLLVPIFIVFMIISTLSLSLWLKKQLFPASLHQVLAWVLSLLIAALLSFILFIGLVLLFFSLFPGFLADS
jgi:hypothetical protein